MACGRILKFCVYVLMSNMHTYIFLSSGALGFYCTLGAVCNPEQMALL